MSEETWTLILPILLFFIKSFPFSILQIDKVKLNCRFSPVRGRKHGKTLTALFSNFSSLLETFIDFSQISCRNRRQKTSLICRKDSFWLNVMKFLSLANIPVLNFSREGKRGVGSESVIGIWEIKERMEKARGSFGSGIFMSFW